MAEKIVPWYNYCLQKAVYDGNYLNYPWQQFKAHYLTILNTLGKQMCVGRI